MHPHQVRRSIPVTQILTTASPKPVHRSIYELYGHGNSYEDVHSQTQACAHLWERFKENTSLRFNVTAYSDRIPMSRQKEIVDSFAFMEMRGKIDLKNPDETFNCYEECMARPDFRAGAF